MKTYNNTYDHQLDAMEAVGSYHLANNPDIYEPQRKNTFEVVVSGLSNLPYAGAPGQDGVITSSASDDLLRLCVKTVKLPHFKQTPITVRRGNSVMKAAGLPDFESGSLTVRDFVGSDVIGILMAWQNKSYNVMTQKVGLMSEYKKDAVLIEYSPNYKKVRSWQLKGCWVSALSEGEFSQEDGGMNEISVTLEYDYAYPLD